MKSIEIDRDPHEDKCGRPLRVVQESVQGVLRIVQANPTSIHVFDTTSESFADPHRGQTKPISRDKTSIGKDRSRQRRFARALRRIRVSLMHHKGSEGTQRSAMGTPMHYRRELAGSIGLNVHGALRSTVRLMYMRRNL